MVLTDYFTEDGDGLRFTRQQASRFAKEIADDFNPLHHQDAKLFCVPGDLLFAVTLAKYGLSQRMCFTFSGMVSDGINLQFQEQGDHELILVDEQQKTCLGVERHGPVSHDAGLIIDFTRRYVEFSGKNFLNVLVPLMSREGVMINPDRPLVIYQQMSIDLQCLDIENPSLELQDTVIEVDGKKGDVRMLFCLKSGNRVVGTGEKRMALRGLRAYDQAGMDRMVDSYEGYRQAHSA
ncbi:DUF3581 family protein [Sedimenticola thiotaurini]|uniref:DUF3581 family protein n=1 Tax=Sedimenticola thiotaurini TaxID=1543721 RepID=A0A0F7JS87_9GAMM|nr:DUF3581 family protein [Sedimenticola thiotaurini]AKH19341.1 hypothetical protein AAY24_02120 [Sedimenticola thiotaurini]